MENIYFLCLLVPERLSSDDVGVARGTVFQELRPWAGSRTANEASGGGLS